MLSSETFPMLIVQSGIAGAPQKLASGDHAWLGSISEYIVLPGHVYELVLFCDWFIFGNVRKCFYELYVVQLARSQPQPYTMWVSSSN